jgi:hypothetical protein
MTIEEVIVTKLAAVAPAHPLVMPIGAVLPCVVYQRISGQPLFVGDYTNPRYQLSCWAASYAAAVALGASVRSAFFDQHVTVSGVHFHSQVINDRDDAPDLDTGLFRRLIDVRFFLREPTT